MVVRGGRPSDVDHRRACVVAHCASVAGRKYGLNGAEMMSALSTLNGHRRPSARDDCYIESEYETNTQRALRLFGAPAFDRNFSAKSVGKLPKWVQKTDRQAQLVCCSSSLSLGSANKVIKMIKTMISGLFATWVLFARVRLKKIRPEV